MELVHSSHTMLKILFPLCELRDDWQLLNLFYNTGSVGRFCKFNFGCGV